MQQRIKLFKQFAQENKKNLIVTGVGTVLLLIVLIITSSVRGVFRDGLVSVNSQITDVRNQTNQLNDAINQNTMNQVAEHTNTKVEYVGNKIDIGLWQADDQYFWEFLSPAFSFKNGDEYNEIRQKYVDSLGYCLFTTNVMGPFDKESYDNPDQANDEMMIRSSSFASIPMSLSEDGYSYMGIVTFDSSKAYKDYGRNVMLFTYKITHLDTNDVVIDNFNVWPVKTANITQ